MTLTQEAAQKILARFHAEAAAAATDQEAAAVADALEAFVRKVRAQQWERYPWQHPHIHPEGWVSQRAPGKAVCDERCMSLPSVEIGVHDIWLQRGGRGTGKTEGAAHYMNAHAESPPCDTRAPGGHRFTIVAPTQTDAVSSCVEGISGLKAINPGITVTTGKQGTIAVWPNGVVARLLGAHSRKDVDRARAWSNVCLWWLEEAAAQPQLAGMLEQGPYTLRLGDRAHTVATTTPQNRPEVAALIDGPQPTDAEAIRTIERASVQTWGRTRDAYRLPEPVREKLEVRFAGTSAGAQELDGDLIADTPGALWVSHRPDLVDGLPNTDHRPGIGNDRLPAGSVGWVSHARPEGLGGNDAYNAPIQPPQDVLLTVSRTIVSIDPPGGRTECGITVIGAYGTHGYVLADLSGKFTPDVWARIALEAYYDYGAEGLAVEHTYGGDMVPEVIGTRAELLGVPPPPIFKVSTKVGKRLRAEPVQGLYQQHRMHHVGVLPGVETEQRTWVPNETTESPNRIDALVHGSTYLLIVGRAGAVSNPTSLPTTTRMPSTFGRGRMAR